jgi:hypothetical protein
VTRLPCRRYLEVGARNGISVDMVGRGMPDGAQIVVVELAGGLWGDPASRKPLEAVCARLKQHRGHAVSIIWGDSRNPDTVAALRKIITPFSPEFDMVFIDADHTYEAVKDDWENYGSLGSVVVFDDIATEIDEAKVFKGHNGNVPATYGVSRLWEELKANQKDWTCYEIIEEGSHNGKGVLVWGAETPQGSDSAISIWKEYAGSADDKPASPSP